MVDRKELLRILIEKITVAVVGDSELVDVTITWAGGHITSGRAVRPVTRHEQLSYYPQMIHRIDELAAQGLTSRAIADHLNAEGMRPAKRATRFGSQQVLDLARRHDIVLLRRRAPQNALSDLGPDEWSVSTLASHLSMPAATIYDWIYCGWISPRRAPNNRNLIIVADTTELHRLEELRDRPRGYYTRQRWAQLKAGGTP